MLLIPLALFFLLLVVPEYVACLKLNSEGAMGTDIWGGEVQCFGESKEFGAVFFQMLSAVIAILLVLLIGVLYFINKLKRNFK